MERGTDRTSFCNTSLSRLAATAPPEGSRSLRLNAINDLYQLQFGETLHDKACKLLRKQNMVHAAFYSSCDPHKAGVYCVLRQHNLYRCCYCGLG